MSPKKILGLALTTLLLTVPGANALDAILTDDISINVNNPPRIQKSDRPILNFSEENAVFLKFDIESVLPPNIASPRVEKATLVVFVNNVKRTSWGGLLAVFPVVGTWNERSGLTTPSPNLSELPHIGNLIEDKPIFFSKTYVVFDVTTLVKSWIDGTPNNGIVLKGRAPTVRIPEEGGPDVPAEGAIDSKENTATSHPARLQITLTGQ